jgi:mRNA interferase MazF
LRRGDLVTVALQGDYGKPRPALIIQSDFYSRTESVSILLLTSTLNDASLLRYTLDPSPTNGLRVRSQVQIDRVMSPPRSKVGPTIGHLDEEELLSISRLLAVFLGVAA